MERLTSFASREEAFDALSARMEFIMSEKIAEKGMVKVLLSGGSTPLPVYQRLSLRGLNFSNVRFGLVDDRFVGVDDPASNEGVIRTLFNHVASFNLEGMVSNPLDYQESITRCHEAYRFFHEGDIALLGMGNDGHFASLFPHDESSMRGLTETQNACIGTTAPAHPVQRISCNLSFLKTIQHRILLIIGEDKKEKLLACHTEKTPISYILNDLTEIFYAP